MINTYSNATLSNTERIVLNQEPDAKVFRYIKRSELSKIFEQRKRKIIDFTSSAENFADRGQVADALKYYYWALSLLRSHPEASSLEFPDKNGQQRLLVGYLPAQINALLGSLNFSVANIQDNPNHRIVTLNITSGGRPVTNFEYSFWDGRDWSAPVGAKDGIGFIEFFGENAAQRNETRIKSEYIFEGEAIIDRELEDVLKKLEPIPFRTAYFNLNIEKSDKPVASAPTTTTNASAVSPAPRRENALSNTRLADLKLESVANAAEYDKKVEQIIGAVQSGNLSTVKSLFTTEGFDTFQKLVGYGQAQVISYSNGTSIKFGEWVVYRGPKMSFSFKNNRRKFVEDVVFHFDKTGKVASVVFALEQDAVNSIVGNTQWSEAERMTIVNFLEHYKTAYALKRIDYIRSIFADDALIIVGNVVKVKTTGDNPFQDNTIIKYNRYSKEQYLKNLQHCFNSNEFINIKFEESNIRKAGNTGRFGIQIKQNYHSTNYADQGYLFLLIDFSNPDEPVIHVRTWQPQKNPDGSIYGLEDF